MVDRFGGSDSAKIVEQVASALANIGVALFKLGRLEEALTAFDGVVKSYTGSDSPILREVMASSFANRGNVLAVLKREAEALASWEEAIRGFGAGGLQGRAPSCASVRADDSGLLASASSTNLDTGKQIVLNAAIHCELDRLKHHFLGRANSPQFGFFGRPGPI